MGFSEKDLINVSEVLTRYGQSTVAEMRSKLSTVKQGRSGNGRFRSISGNAIATGRLYDSIAYKVSFDGIESSIEFEMESYGVYVDGGRRPGKMPPLKKIKEWTSIKGIPEKYAFPIARNIGKHGIAARPFFSSTVERTMDSMVEELEIAYAEDIHRYLTNNLKFQ